MDMKKMLDLLNEHINNVYCEKYRVYNHPAKDLDEYMKEQYMLLLLSIIRESDSAEDAVDFWFYLSKKIDFIVNPESVTKKVYQLDDKKTNDCVVSFEHEEIRYLLVLDMLMIISEIKNQDSAEKYAEKMVSMLGVFATPK